MFATCCISVYGIGGGPPDSDGVVQRLKQRAHSREVLNFRPREFSQRSDRCCGQLRASGGPALQSVQTLQATQMSECAGPNRRQSPPPCCQRFRRGVQARRTGLARLISAIYALTFSPRTSTRSSVGSGATSAAPNDIAMTSGPSSRRKGVTLQTAWEMTLWKIPPGSRWIQWRGSV